MKAPLPLLAVAATVLLAASACTEPVDCGSGPGRCLNKRSAPQEPAAAIAVPARADLELPKDFEHHAQVIHRGRREPADLVRRIMNVAANKNLRGLKRFCTPALAKTTDEMIRDHKDRFWRHLAKYVTAASDGFTIEEAPGPTETKRRLTVKTRAGIVLNPVIEKDKGGWLFDRF